LESWFQYKEHVCMVFQKYGLSLYDYLKKNSFQGLDYAITREIAFSLFASLYYLHEGLELIHTDLKPENILFVEDTTGFNSNDKSPDIRMKPTFNSTDIKIIDLGSATFEHEYHSTIISTRHYRAPEVVLQIGWSYPSDVWSVGCILLELYTGQTLFNTHQNSEHLAMMEIIFGHFPPEWLESQKKSKNNIIADYFEVKDQDSKAWLLKWYRTATIESKKRVKNMKKLSHLISKEHKDFFDLMTKLLIYDPSTRLTAGEALDHAYFDVVRERYRNESAEKKSDDMEQKQADPSELVVTSMSSSRSDSEPVSNQTKDHSKESFENSDCDSARLEFNQDSKRLFDRSISSLIADKTQDLKI